MTSNYLAKLIQQSDEWDGWYIQHGADNIKIGFIPVAEPDGLQQFPIASFSRNIARINSPAFLNAARGGVWGPDSHSGGIVTVPAYMPPFGTWDEWQQAKIDFKKQYVINKEAELKFKLPGEGNGSDMVVPNAKLITIEDRLVAAETHPQSASLMVLQFALLDEFMYADSAESIRLYSNPVTKPETTISLPWTFSTTEDPENNQGSWNWDDDNYAQNAGSEVFVVDGNQDATWQLRVMGDYAATDTLRLQIFDEQGVVHVDVEWTGAASTAANNLLMDSDGTSFIRVGTDEDYWGPMTKRIWGSLPANTKLLARLTAPQTLDPDSGVLLTYTPTFA